MTLSRSKRISITQVLPDVIRIEGKIYHTVVWSDKKESLVTPEQLSQLKNETYFPQVDPLYSQVALPKENDRFVHAKQDWEIEKIISHTKEANAPDGYSYTVKWKGWGKVFNDKVELTENNKDLVALYWKTLNPEQDSD